LASCILPAPTRCSRCLSSDKLYGCKEAICGRAGEGVLLRPTCCCRCGVTEAGAVSAGRVGRDGGMEERSFHPGVHSILCQSAAYAGSELMTMSHTSMALISLRNRPSGFEKTE